MAHAPVNVEEINEEDFVIIQKDKNTTLFKSETERKSQLLI